MDLWILIELQDIVPSGWGEMPRSYPSFFIAEKSAAQHLQIGSRSGRRQHWSPTCWGICAPGTVDEKGCIPPITTNLFETSETNAGLYHVISTEKPGPETKNSSWNQDTLVMRSICARLCHDLLNSWPMIPGWFSQKVLKIVHGAPISLEDGKKENALHPLCHSFFGTIAHPLWQSKHE